MKRCILCPNKVTNDAPPICEECCDELDLLAGIDSVDLAAKIKDLEEEQLPF